MGQRFADEANSPIWVLTVIVIWTKGRAKSLGYHATLLLNTNNQCAHDLGNTGFTLSFINTCCHDLFALTICHACIY